MVDLGLAASEHVEEPWLSLLYGIADVYRVVVWKRLFSIRVLIINYF
jgi:hypothetical protein